MKRSAAVAAALAAAALVGCGASEPSELESAGTAPAGDALPRLPESVEALVRELQAIGFFADAGDPRRIARRIAAHQQRATGRPFALHSRADAAVVLAADNRRVWYEDVEADVIEGNDAYVEVLREWARISQGAFRPRDVRERWLGVEGPVRISFDHGGRRRVVEAKVVGDYLDLCVLIALNELTAPRGRRFAVYAGADADALGQVALVVAITEAERSELARSGWTFVTEDRECVGGVR